MSRGVTDRLVHGVARLAGGLVRIPGGRHLVVALAALAALASWPFSDLRARSRAAGLAVSPLAWGAAMGRTLCALLGAGPVIDVQEDDRLHPEPGRGLLVLAAHLGPWEAGAAELARRGLRPLVLAAPWPRLPRTEALVEQLRAVAGVRSVARGAGGWREATRLLRDGGTVVILVDSASPERRGRRPVPFVGGAIAAPDAVIRWARRQGAEVRVAAWQRGSFLIQAPGAGPVHQVAEQVVARLRAAVRASPSEWAWVRALACLPLALLLLPACPGEPVPPLPRDPEHWVVDAEGPSWSGPLPGELTGRFIAERATVRWRDGAPHGRFEEVEVDLSGRSGAWLGSLVAATGEGSWPEGPLELRDVRWSLAEPAREGELETLTWRADGRWSCGGCPLEELLGGEPAP